MAPTPSLEYTLTPLSGDRYTFCLCGSERKTVSWTMAPSALGERQAFIHTDVAEVEELMGNELVLRNKACLLLGVVNVSVSAEAVASHASCDNEIVSVPERGRIDVVTRSLIVKVGTSKQDGKVKVHPSVR